MITIEQQVEAMNKRMQMALAAWDDLRQELSEIATDAQVLTARAAAEKHFAAALCAACAEMLKETVANMSKGPLDT